MLKPGGITHFGVLELEIGLLTKGCDLITLLAVRIWLMVTMHYK